MNTVLSGLRNCNAYLDDLIVFRNSWPDHNNVLRQVFDRLAKASLTMNPAKCEFGKATITYLGKQVEQGQMQPVEEKVRAVMEIPVLSTRRQLCKFLGMAGYYRGFCRKFSAIAKPLTTLTSPRIPFRWTQECQHAFESVKALLCHAPVLAAPVFERPFKLEVDASAVGAGAVLLQDNNDGVEHPVSFFSRKFNKHQWGYSVIEKETLALLWALQHLKVYIGTSSLPIVVYSDHNPLTFLSKLHNRECSGRHIVSNVIA